MMSNFSAAPERGNGPLAPPVRFWHLAMILLVFAALLTGDGADDYKKAEHAGFLLHGRIGAGVFVTLCLYFAYSFFGPQEFRLARWFPLTGGRLRQTVSDLKTLASFKLPEHKRRQGLAGFVQFFGLMVFAWLAGTGILMYLFLEPGRKAAGLLHAVKEGHEAGAALIFVYLALHVGAVIAHSLTGHPVWREIFFLKNNRPQ